MRPHEKRVRVRCKDNERLSGKLEPGMMTFPISGARGFDFCDMNCEKWTRNVQFSGCTGGFWTFDVLHNGRTVAIGDEAVNPSLTVMVTSSLHVPATKMHDKVEEAKEEESVSGMEEFNVESGKME